MVKLFVAVVRSKLIVSVDIGGINLRAEGCDRCKVPVRLSSLLRPSSPCRARVEMANGFQARTTS